MKDNFAFIPIHGARATAGAFDMMKALGMDREPRLNNIVTRLANPDLKKIQVSRNTAVWLLECAGYDLLRDRVKAIEARLHDLDIEVVQ